MWELFFGVIPQVQGSSAMLFCFVMTNSAKEGKKNMQEIDWSQQESGF